MTLIFDKQVSLDGPVRLNDERTVWKLFLILIPGSSLKDEVLIVTKHVWDHVCVLLIRHGAESVCPFDTEGTLMVEKVLKVFLRNPSAGQPRFLDIGDLKLMFAAKKCNISLSVLALCFLVSTANWLMACSS